MRILVTGGRGLVGGLVGKAAEGRHVVWAAGRAELDVTDERSIERALYEFAPDVVINCAAFTNVDGAERESETARAVNAQGAGKLAAAARALPTALIHVSTDYVFDGEARRPYREEDPTRPLSAYGRSKLEGEQLVAAAHPGGHVIVRTAWIYGPGAGFVDWARGRLERGEELPLINDQTGSPTSAVELAGALLRLAEGGHRGLFHYVNSGATSWLELGEVIASELGSVSPRIRPVRARDLKRAATRPAYTVLSVARYEDAVGELVPTWREALARYLAR